jgi:hypothetical protein
MIYQVGGHTIVVKQRVILSTSNKTTVFLLIAVFVWASDSKDEDRPSSRLRCYRRWFLAAFAAATV